MSDVVKIKFLMAPDYWAACWWWVLQGARHEEDGQPRRQHRLPAPDPGLRPRDGLQLRPEPHVRVISARWGHQGRRQGSQVHCAEKGGILKKPGPYCPLEKERWEDRLSSSSQNNLVNLTSGPHDGRGRARPRAQVRLQAGHLLLGCRENTEVTQWIPRRYSRGESTILMLNFIPSSLSTPSVQYLHLPSPLPVSADLLQSLTQALRDAASARGHPAHPGYSTLDTAPVLTEELKRHLAETRAVNEYR